MSYIYLAIVNAEVNTGDSGLRNSSKGMAKQTEECVNPNNGCNKVEDDSRSRIVNFSCVNEYFENRQRKTEEKLEKIKYEKLLKEEAEMRDRPQISKNSKEIVKALMRREQQALEKEMQKLQLVIQSLRKCGKLILRSQ